MIGISPRSSAGRAALLLRLLAVVLLVVGFMRQHHGWWWPVSGLILAGALVMLARRSKAPISVGALWSASADLITDHRRYPGQLSLAEHEVTWVPSTYAVRRGATPLSIPVEHAHPRLEAGPALLDVRVLVSPDDGKSETVFLTHRSRGLVRAVRQLSPDGT